MELTHPKLAGIRLNFLLECDKNGRVGRRQNKYRFKEIELIVNTKRVFMSIDVLIHSEFLNKMPNDLLLNCPSTDQIFDFVDTLNSNFEKSFKESTDLLEMIESYNAMLCHDSDFNSIIKHTLISISEMKLYDVVIDVHSISELVYRNIFIQPHVEFSDNVSNLDVGLPFLNRFLGNVKNYLKL